MKNLIFYSFVLFFLLTSCGIPRDIVVSFSNCTKDCDQIEDQVENSYDQCLRRIREDSIFVAKCIEDLIKHDRPLSPECMTRISEYTTARQACIDSYRTGKRRVTECRIRCNNLISIRQD